MKAEIIALKKEENSIIVSIVCTPPNELSEVDPYMVAKTTHQSTSILEGVIKKNKVHDEREKKIAIYKRQMNMLHFGEVIIGQSDWGIQDEKALVELRLTRETLKHLTRLARKLPEAFISRDAEISAYIEKLIEEKKEE